MTTTHTYRADIDGLRAVAVLSVFGFHLELTGFSGGFVGVDVFFVISGYLMTRILKEELERTGHIDVWAFYIRRARRLLPALLLVIAMTLCAFAFVASSDRMADLGRSAIYAVLSISNIHFWLEADYFDASALTKPLLHTWSLGVEEQFYIVWPILLGVLLQIRTRRRLLTVLTLIGAASLSLNFLLGPGMLGGAIGLDAAQNGKMTIFYLPVFRFFEFVIGAVLVWVATPRSETLRTGLFLTGLAMIAMAVVFYSDDILYPVHHALLPCTGTAFVIIAGPAHALVGLLTNRLATFLGRISYSTYLLHWPVIVFFNLLLFRMPNLLECLLIGIFTLGASWLLHIGVEQRFRIPTGQRTRGGNRAAFVSIIASSTIILSVSVDITSRSGWTFRIPPDRLAATEEGQRFAETALCGTSLGRSHFVNCAHHGGDGREIHIWGDSHARHLIFGFARVFPEDRINVIYSSACPPQSGFMGYVKEFESSKSMTEDCVMHNQQVFDHLADRPATNIILHSYLFTDLASDTKWLAASQYMVSELRKKGHRVMVLSDVIRPNKPISACYAVPAVISERLIRYRCTGEPELTAGLRMENRRIEQGLPPGYFINLTDTFCQDPVTCPVLDGGKPIFRDTHHLTPHGSTLFVKRGKALLETALK